MKTYFDCIPCFVRQALDAVRFVTDDENIQEKVLREVLKLIGDLDLKRTPPEIACDVHKIIRKVSGSDDPYAEIKTRLNEAALGFLPKLEKMIEESDDPFDIAVRIAVAGNIIDFGFTSAIDKDRIGETIEKALSYPFPEGDIERFRNAVKSANKILYLADNAGEIIFDRLLIEQLPKDSVTLVVKGGAFLNDVLIADAEQAGLGEICEVIDNGSGVPGTALETCSDDFMERFGSADVIISKGMANYETLSDVDGPIWFLFQVKCGVISGDIGLDVGTMVVKGPS